MLAIEIRRMSLGPPLVIEAPQALVLHFLQNDPSAAPGGYDDLAGRGDPWRITRDDIVAINTTMRARSPHSAWAKLIESPEPPAWLRAVHPDLELLTLDDALWLDGVREAVDTALNETVGRGRGLSVATKVLHLKRPRMFPVLDSLVLQQLGVTESVPALAVIDHLRNEGRRNLQTLLAVQRGITESYDRSLVRILDVLLWSSHPAAGLAPQLNKWQHVFRRAET